MPIEYQFRWFSHQDSIHFSCIWFPTNDLVWVQRQFINLSLEWIETLEQRKQWLAIKKTLSFYFLKKLLESRKHQHFCALCIELSWRFVYPWNLIGLEVVLLRAKVEGSYLVYFWERIKAMLLSRRWASNLTMHQEWIKSIQMASGRNVENNFGVKRLLSIRFC